MAEPVMDDPAAAMDLDVRAALERRGAASKPLWEKTAQEARQSRAGREAAARLEGGLVLHDTIIELEDRDLPIRIYEGAREDDIIIVFFHGGGFVTGNLDTHHDQALMLARATRRTLVSVDYRLAPEHPFPAANDDAFSLVDWVRSAHGAAELRLHAPRVAVAGVSAGANLAANASREFAQRGEPLIAQLLAYPWLDARQSAESRRLFFDGLGLSTRMLDWYIRHYLPDPASRRDPAVWPLSSTLFDRLPPTALSVAMLDPLRDDGLQYATRLKAAGRKVVLQTCPTLPHGFWGMAKDSPAAEAASTNLCTAFAALLDEL